MCFAANIEVNPDRFGLAAAQHRIVKGNLLAATALLRFAL